MNKIAVWVIVLSTIFGFVIFWSYILPVYKENIDTIDAEVGANLTSDAQTAYETTQNSFGTLIQNSAAAVLVVMILWGILSMQRRERVEGYYRV